MPKESKSPETLQEFAKWLRDQTARLEIARSHPDGLHEGELQDIAADVNESLRLAFRFRIEPELPANLHIAFGHSEAISLFGRLLDACDEKPQEQFGLDAELTVAQAAKRINVSPGAIYDAIAAKKLPHKRIGKGRGTIRIRLGDLLAYAKERIVPVATPNVSLAELLRA